MVDRNVHFEQIAAVTGVDTKKIAALNPQYRRSIINGETKPSILRLEPQEITAFIDNEDSICACSWGCTVLTALQPQQNAW